ncbi:hypothetical protein [Dermatophilus congolensis]|uniref:Uncharacterized response regulatory protein Rv3143/MT3230 n=1 Tax=Dermatophilus congolensis TaxID=1863 RepID=A0A239VQA1_9MICO|nr:hypothetical protein [Dermatophilus congolensis]SNV23828.1 Uncharacterized response regulatory protein Rv3143/MT3230 [Dermatophilus congolensis]
MSELAGSSTTPTPAAAGGVQAEAVSGTTGQSAHKVRVLLYSDDASVREQVKRSVGHKPARDVEVVDWTECATPVIAEKHVKAGGLDLLILDGESVPLGGMGLCRQLKCEVYDCPPVIVLTGRPQDAWLAAWSLADRAVPQPIDPLVMANAVADVARESKTGSIPAGAEVAR